MYINREIDGDGIGEESGRQVSTTMDPLLYPGRLQLLLLVILWVVFDFSDISSPSQLTLVFKFSSVPHSSEPSRRPQTWLHIVFTPLQFSPRLLHCDPFVPFPHYAVALLRETIALYPPLFPRPSAEYVAQH